MRSSYGVEGPCGPPALAELTEGILMTANFAR